MVLNHPNLGTTGADAANIAADLNARRPDSAMVIAADVSSAEAVQVMMQEVKARHGGLDFLINNAAILKDRTIAKMGLDEWDAVIDVNLSGVFYCCKFALEIMRDHGAIVSYGCIAALQGFFGQANYAAANAALDELSVPGKYEALDVRCNRFYDGLAKIIRDAGIDGYVVGMGPVLQVWFAKQPIKNYRDAARYADHAMFRRWWEGMLERNILFHPGAFENLFVSFAHSDDDIDATLAAAADVCKTLR